MNRIANGLTDYYVRKKYIPNDKKEIYSYGFKLIISDIINFTLVAVLGLITGDVLAGITFLIALCCVRKFSGGFHAKTFWLCRISMLITYLLVTAISELIIFYGNIFVPIIINSVSVIVISILSPVRHPNKTLTDKQAKTNKTKAIITSSLMSAISIILIMADIKYGVTISTTLLAIVILMIIGLIVTKGGKKNV